MTKNKSYPDIKIKNVSPKLHREFKTACYNLDIGMATIAKQLIREWLEKQPAHVKDNPIDKE